MKYLKSFNEAKTTHANKELSKLIGWAVEVAKCSTKKTKNGIMLYPPDDFDKSLEPRTIHLAERAIFDVMRSIATWYNVKKKDVEVAYSKNEKPTKK